MTPSNQLLPALFIGGVSIRQDQDGRYFLNDLHRAAGGNKKDQPYEFLRLDSTVALIAELRISEFPGSDRINHLDPIRAVKSFTEEQGTYVVKELVYAYAMWISVAFMLHVIRTFDHAVTHQIAEANDKLLMMRTELKFSVPAPKYLAVIDQRDALQEKYLELVNNPPPAFGVPRLWTEVEDIQAMDAYLSGLGFTRIGFPLGRTKDSVRHRFKAKLFARLPDFVAQHHEVYKHLTRAQAVLSGGAA